MRANYSDTRKMGARVKPDGSPADNNRVEIGPTALAFAEWAAAGLDAPNLAAMRSYRLGRLVSAIHARGYGGMLMFDPLNIRYATDSTNMQLWNTHNPFRACLVCADGHMVLWEYKNSPFLAEHNPLVAEIRPSLSMFYNVIGDKATHVAAQLSAQVQDLLQAHAGSNKRLGVDKIMIDGLRALEAAGLTVYSGEELTEKARSIKGPDELKAMRCAMHACEQSIAAMHKAMQPGMSENDIWAVLHAENIKRGGEWIETRLLSTGPRTSPWFQECGPRIVQNNEIVAFDTDLIGAYGMCCDISRTWWLGDAAPRPDMVSDYLLAQEHIRHNMGLVRAGLPISEWIARSHVLAPAYQRFKYSCLAHGVGLCDEWPMAVYPDHYQTGAFDYPLQAGMTLCIEALITREGGDFSIKLEDQIVVTEDGFENLTRYPWDARLMGLA